MGSNDANMTLRIDADEGKATKALLDLENTERRLDVAIKAGNRTIKARIDGEADLAKVLGKVEAGERAALASALKSLPVLADKSAATKRVGEESLMAGKRAAAFLRQAMVPATLVAGLNLIRTELEKIDAAYVKSAKGANAQAKTLREFIAQQAPGADGQQFVGETLIRGATSGLTPEQSAALAGPLQSIADRDGNGVLAKDERTAFDSDFGAAAGMRESGIAAEDALKIVTAGRARGQSGKESADLMAKAAQLSAINPSDVAKSISATSEFSDQKEALSVLTALSKEQTEVGKLPAAMERLGVVLGASGEVGETEKFSKKYKLGGLSETEKIAKLRAYAMQHGEGATPEERLRSFTAKLPGEEGLAKETALDLARVIRQADTVGSTKTALNEGASGSLDAILKKGLASPLTGPGIVQDRQAALAAVGELVGPQAVEAQKRLSMRQLEGAAMIAAGDVANVEDTGEAKAFGDQTLGAWARKGWEGMGRSASVGYGYPPAAAEIARQQQVAASAPPVTMEGVMAAQAELVKALQENNRLLSENSLATKENSSASKGKAPVGGAASNAEEKY